MALRALGPAVRPGLGFSLSTVTGAASAVSGPVGAVASAVTGVEGLLSSIHNIFGGGSGYGTPAGEGAERSRADSYLIGIAHGSVEAGQYLIGQHQSDTSSFAQSYTSQILAAAQSNYPQVMQQASQAGALHDTENGYNGLLILSQLGVHYSETYAGYSTGNASAPTGATAALVQQLAALPQLGTSTIPGTSIPSGTATGALGGAISGASMPLLIGAGILAAVFFSTRPKPRRGR